jgi:type III secretory pathway lipoprotein EscJ
MAGRTVAGWMRPALAGAALLCLTGCDTAIATGVDEAQASRTLVSLQAVGIVAEKTPLPGDPQHYSITVARGDAPAALQRIVEQRLLDPDREPIGVLHPQADDVLVKSRDQERAELAQRVAGEVERSLLVFDEVVSARVHLALASQQDRDGNQRPARASVLLRTHGPTPLSEGQIKTLVLGAVSDLTADDIEVVAVATTPPKGQNPPRLTRIGPITLTEQSAASFRFFALGLIGSNLALLAICSVMWWRRRKLDSEGS